MVLCHIHSKHLSFLVPQAFCQTVKAHVGMVMNVKFGPTMRAMASWTELRHSMRKLTR